MPDYAHLGIVVDSKDVTHATTELKQMGAEGKSIGAMARAMAKDVTTSNHAMHGAARAMAGSMGDTAKAMSGAARAARGFDLRGISMQLSQVAQQASATGRPLQALAIQLPDLAMYLGGPLAIGIGAAAGALLSLTSGMGGARSAAERLDDQIDTLSDALAAYRQTADRAALTTKELRDLYGDAAEGMRSIAQMLLEISAEQAQREIDGLSHSITELLGTSGDGEARAALADFFDVNLFLAFSKAGREARATARSLTAAFQAQQVALANSSGDLDAQIESLGALIGTTRSLAAAVDGVSTEEDALLTSMSSALDAMLRLKSMSVDAAAELSPLAQALNDLRDATERVSDVSVPAAANAVELMRQYGDLSSAAIGAARAQHELATAETMDSAIAATESLTQGFLGVADQVGMTDRMMGEFLDAMQEVHSADTPGEMARGFGEVLRIIEVSTGGVEKMDEQTRAVYASTAVLTQQLLDAAEAAYGGADAAGSFGNAIAAATAAANGLWQNLEGARATLASLGQGLAGLGRSLPILNALIPAGQTAADGIGGALGGVVGRLRGRLAGLADVGRDIVANMQEIANKGAPALDHVGGAARQAEKSLSAAQVAAKDLADTFKSGLTSAIEGVGQAFGDLFTGGIDSFKDFAQRIWGGFRKLLSDMIATAVANPIKISMGLLTGTGAYAGVPGGPVGGGMLSGLMGGMGGLFRGVGQGLSSVVGGLFSGGIGGAASAIGQAFGGIGSGITGIGTAIGAALPVVGLAAAAFSLFRSKTSELDRGLQVTIGKTGTLTETFRDLEKSRFFGLIKRHSTEMHRASDALSAPIQQAVDAMRGATISAADAIGVSAHRIGGYSRQIRLSTKGMSDEAAQKAILDQLGSVSDELAKLVIGDRSIRAGEAASQALSAMQVAMQTINTAFEGLGLKALAGGISSANAARAMIDAAGGVQNFAQAADLYFQNFYSVGEQAQEMSRRFRAGMDGLGVGVIPATIEQFRGIVDRLNAEGRNAAAAGMIGLAPLFKSMKELQTRAASAADGIAGVGAALSGERDGLLRQLYRLTDNTVALRALELKHLLPANHALQRRIWALQEERKIAEQVQAAQRATVDLLRKPLNLDAGRFSNRYEATMQAARDRDAEIAREAAKAQLTQLTLIRRAVKEIRDEQRDANLRRTDA